MRKSNELSHCRGDRVLFIGETVGGGEVLLCPLKKTCARYSSKSPKEIEPRYMRFLDRCDCYIKEI